MPLPNLFGADPVLREHLATRLDDRTRKRAEAALDDAGWLAADRVDELAHVANRNPPTLKRYDRHGDRVDEVELHPAYEEMRSIAYGEMQLVHRSYEASAGDDRLPRPATFALAYLFAQAEQGLTCPVCLTDGTALLVDRYADEEVRDAFLPDLTADDLDQLREGAMFLTETAGGSDVGANETTAVEDDDGTWRIAGRKWFCSNANAEAWMVLARPAGAPDGTEGLGLFLVPRTLDDGSRNAFRIERLKDKLGTRSMATGEIELDGAEAIPLGGPGEGFPRMTDMLTMSRVWNSVASAAVARRALVESVRYAREREAFGRTLDAHPLHRRVLAEMTLGWEAALVLGLECASLMEAAWFDPDAPEAKRERARTLLRVLTPLAKNLTARTAVDLASEACENLGGNGYIEDWPTPRLLRDAQVLPIWEGTTSILSLDVLRAAHREGAVADLLGHLEGRLDAGEAPDDVEATVRAGLHRLGTRWTELADASPEEAQARSRRLTFQLARAACAVLLAEHATGERAEVVARTYAELHLGDRDAGEALLDQVALEDYELVVDGAVAEG